jgi:glycosyltransferase involved in cell wall biosynthesis
MTCFSIITPCYNAEKYIRETIESVINQAAVISKRVSLEYIIVDGGSSDTTLEIIDSIKSPHIKVISEKDTGMYDALAKGLKLATGDICAYINADDYYNEHAFDIVLDVFLQKKINWLTGIRIFYNEHSQIVNTRLPYKYRNEFIKIGYYGKKFPFIQQESTFWDSKLNQCIDYDILSQLRYAGDFYLWSKFCEISHLNIVQAYLGGFRIHKGQLSGNIKSYMKEMETLTDSPRARDVFISVFDMFLWQCPAHIQKYFNNNSLFIYNHVTQEWV